MIKRFSIILLILLIPLNCAFGQEFDDENEDKAAELSSNELPVEAADADGFEERRSMSSFSSSKQEQKFQEDNNGDMVPIVNNHAESSHHSRDHESRKFHVKDGKKEFFDEQSSHESGSGPLSSEEMEKFGKEQKKLGQQFERERSSLEAKFNGQRQKLAHKFGRIFSDDDFLDEMKF